MILIDNNLEVNFKKIKFKIIYFKLKNNILNLN